MRMTEFRRELRQDGYEMEQLNGGHIRITHPKMDAPVVMAFTPSDRRAIANTRAMLRRKRREQIQARADRIRMTGEA